MSDTKTATDAWIQKTRALGRNTVIWEKWRETVTNLATPATDLETAAASVLPTVFRESGSDFVLEAVAMHPNAPPNLLAQIVERWPNAARAFCENPIAPFLLLETPDFLALLDEEAQLALLREADCPPVLVRLITLGGAAKSEAVQTAAHLHIAVAGEATETGEWEDQLRDYFKNRCAEDMESDGYAREQNADLVEMGFAPAWANGPTLPPEPAPIIRHEEADEEALREWFRCTPAPDTVEEKALLERIVPRIRKRDPLAGGVLVKGLRMGATPDDLMALFQASDGRGIIARAVIRHPAVTPDLIRVLAKERDFSLLESIATHPKTPPDIILFLFEGDFPIYPLVRRLARRHPNAPLNVGRVSRDIFLSTAGFGRNSRGGEYPSMFASFVICLQRANEAQGGSSGLQNDLPRRAEHPVWTTRLEAVLLAKNNETVFEGDEAKRTGGDLLNHLARDGNRIVRAAAQTRLTDPNYKFIL